MKINNISEITGDSINVLRCYEIIAPAGFDYISEKFNIVRGYKKE